MVEVNPDTYPQSKKYDEQFAVQKDILLKVYGEILNILSAQSRIDTARKEVNRQKALEIANNMVKTLTEYPPQGDR